jgi:hypothetical protein
MHFGEIVSGEAIPYDTTHDGLGITTITGAPDAGIYSGYRWFEGIDSGLNAGSSEVNDPAKLKCHWCDVRREMFWDGTEFRLVDPTDPGRANKGGENLWERCHDNLQQRSCEYSSGTCYVEERRTWGYVTQVRAGCKQAQACYMQKYQNFLVQAGRQCWPGDHTGMSNKIAKRPYDVMADNWISNIVQGGILNAASGSSFGGGGAFGGNPFDATFTDMPGGGMNPDGFFATGGAQTSANTQFFGRNSPVVNGYQNGMVPTSKCYQCCNTEHNCNFNWQPQDEEDWAHAYVWRYDPANAAAGQFGIGLEQTPRVNDFTGHSAGRR